MSIFVRAAWGFLAGALATVPMSGEFLAARRARLIDELPPHKAIRSVAPSLPEPRLSRISAVAHLLIGGGAGACYATVLPRKARGPISGIVFGISVWLAGYEAVMPVVTDIPPAHRDQRGRAGTILLAHLIYGAVLGTVLSAPLTGRMRGFSVEVFPKK
jgi:hypothetical protein